MKDSIEEGADLDLVVDLEPAAAAKFVLALSSLGMKPRAPVDPMGLSDPKTRKAWIEEKGMTVFTFFDPKKPLSVVDVFVEPPLPFEELWTREPAASINSKIARG